MIKAWADHLGLHGLAPWTPTLPATTAATTQKPSFPRIRCRDGSSAWSRPFGLIASAARES